MTQQAFRSPSRYSSAGLRTGSDLNITASTSVKTRTIRRDLQALQEAGFPLFDDRSHEDGRTRWKINGQPFVDSSVSLLGLMMASALGIVATPLWGWLTDRVGRRPVYLLGCAVMVAWGVPLFLLVNTGLAALIVLAFVISYAVCQNSLAGVQGAWFSELFATKTRTSGASLAYQLSAVVSGFTPLIATALYGVTGWVGPALLFSAYGLLGLLAALLTRETWGAATREEVARLERSLGPAVPVAAGASWAHRPAAPTV